MMPTPSGRAAALALLAALTTTPASAETWTFALIGDVPYTARERAELPQLIDAAAADKVAFIAHVGDIKNGRDPCTDAMYADRKAVFEASAVPFVYVPGDNEWTDCHRLPAGGYDPLERLGKLREVFFADDRSLGRQRIRFERQPGEYREHVRWRLGPVLFVAVNVPGDDNNFGKGPDASPEFARRNPAVLAWISDGFTLARREKLAGVVVLFQADPAFDHFAKGLGDVGFRPLLDLLQKETRDFAGQVAVLHGDTHWHRIDHPLPDHGTGAPLANFTRVESYGSPFMGWVKGVIDTDQPGLFRFESHPWP